MKKYRGKKAQRNLVHPIVRDAQAAALYPRLEQQRTRRRGAKVRNDRIEEETLDVTGCLACDLLAGRRELPGGIIFQTKCWVVDHCVGPMSAGTLVALPRRHVTLFADLTRDEAAGYGPLLLAVNQVVRQIASADQVYNCLWSFAGWEPGHIHVLVQPVWSRQRQQYPRPGPHQQAAMFERPEHPPRAEVERVAAEARRMLTGLTL